MRYWAGEQCGHESSKSQRRGYFVPFFRIAPWLDQNSEAAESRQNSRQTRCLLYKVTQFCFCVFYNLVSVDVTCKFTTEAFRSASNWFSCCLSPEGQRFRSRASLRTFLLESGSGNLDISLFDFTTSKDDVVTPSQAPPPKVKQRRGKKKPSEGQLEETENETVILEAPPNKSKQASSSLRSDTKSGKVKTANDTNHIDADTELQKTACVLEVNVNGDKSTKILNGCLQALTSEKVDNVQLQKSPQRGGQLREKLLRLAPLSNQLNTSILQEDTKADLQPSAPILNVEPAAESENIGDESKGDTTPNSDLEAGGDSRQDAEEHVLLPDTTDGSCTPVRESQNSKYEPHWLTIC